MAGSKTYVYCNVLPSGYKSPYLYITDFEVKPGDIVIIPLRDREKVGLVIDVNTYSDDVNKVIKKFPNIKVAAYSYDENSGKISVCYSESGYPMFTDKYETDYCDIKDKSAWVLQHTELSRLHILKMENCSFEAA